MGWQNITEVRELGYKFFITGTEYVTCVELRTSLTPPLREHLFSYLVSDLITQSLPW